MPHSFSSWSAILLLSTIFLTGCEERAAIDSSDQTKVVQALDGADLYAQNCSNCHEGQVAKAPHFSLIQQMTSNALFTTQETGIMREQASAMTSAEHKAVAEFISGTKLSDSPLLSSALTCEIGSSPFDFSATPDSAGWGMTLNNQRYQPTSVTGITAADIPNLTLKWAFRYPGAIKARSQPLVLGGALYVGSHAGLVYALDKDTGCIRWSFQAKGEVRNGIISDTWQSGDTNATPKLYFGDIIGNIYAVDAVTGSLAWSARPDDHPSATITAALSLFEGKLYVPISSLEVTAAANPEYACCTFRGGIASYQADTGQNNWTTYTITAEQKVVGQNSIGTDQIAPSGAPIWAGLTLDPVRRRIYAGTGENYSSPADDSSDAIIAFDMDSGTVLWKMQATVGDAWNMACEAIDEINCPSEDGPDYDFAAAPILAKNKNGKQVILAGQKSGEIFALDPDNDGAILWRHKLGRGGIQGGVHFGMAVDGDRLYVPMSDFLGGDRWPGKALPGMFAVDITTGKELWYSPVKNICGDRDYCSPGISAAATAIEGAVLAGSMDGHMRAYDRDSGSIIWDFDSVKTFDTLDGETAQGGSFGGGQGPVFKDGMMYINSGYGVYFHMPGNVLLAFELKKDAK